MCYITVVMSYWNDYICLIRIDSYDELRSDERDGTLNIANESLDFDVTSGYWVICE